MLPAVLRRRGMTGPFAQAHTWRSYSEEIHQSRTAMRVVTVSDRSLTKRIWLVLLVDSHYHEFPFLLLLTALIFPSPSHVSSATTITNKSVIFIDV